MGIGFGGIIAAFSNMDPAWYRAMMAAAMTPMFAIVALIWIFFDKEHIPQRNARIATLLATGLCIADIAVLYTIAAIDHTTGDWHTSAYGITITPNIITLGIVAITAVTVYAIGKLIDTPQRNATA